MKVELDENKKNETNEDFKKSGSESSDEENYDPSIDQMMDECIEMDTQSGENELLFDESDNLELLLQESEVPIETIIDKYGPYVPQKRKAESSDTETSNPTKSQKVHESPNEKEGIISEEMAQAIKYGLRKDIKFKESKKRREIPIGPNHQVFVPDFTGPQLSSESQDEEIIYEPNPNYKTTYEEFVKILQQSYPTLIHPLESMMIFYQKHQGNVESALKDDETINKIILELNSPLVDFTVEECEKMIDAMLTYGKHFSIMRKKVFTNRTTKEIVNFYYIWKTSSYYSDYIKNFNLICRAISASLNDQSVRKQELEKMGYWVPDGENPDSSYTDSDPHSDLEIDVDRPKVESYLLHYSNEHQINNEHIDEQPDKHNHQEEFHD